MSDDEGPSLSARTSVLVMAGTGIVLVAAMFLFEHYRAPSSWLGGWLDQDHLIVLEQRDDDGGGVERIAVHELMTGKRLESRTPEMSPFAVVNGKLWFVSHSRAPGFEAWDTKTLKTVVTREQVGLDLADSSFCLDGTFARVTLKNGRSGTIDLAEGKPVQRETGCRAGSGRGNGAASSGVQGPRGWYGTAWETGIKRQRLVIGDQERLGGTETFLEPQYLLDDGKPIEVEGDVFVVHRIELGEYRALKLSRVGADAVRWTVPLGDPSTLERAVFSEPSTLAVIGHEGIAVFDVKRGNALWRAGR